MNTEKKCKIAKMTFGFIVQGRLGSTRLPNKILLPFDGDNCILDILLGKLEIFNDVKIIVATSVNPVNGSLIKYLTNFLTFRGSENDVLQRFIDAAEYYQIGGIIRICSDNPFLDLEGLKLLIEKASNSKADYIGFWINDTPSIKTHFGFWSEFVTLNALKKVKSLTSEALYHEHVTNYIYTHPDSFNIEWIDTPDFLQNRHDIRLTIDTETDFNSAKSLYAELKQQKKSYGLKEVVTLLNTKSELIKSMKKQIIQNSK